MAKKRSSPGRSAPPRQAESFSSGQTTGWPAYVPAIVVAVLTFLAFSSALQNGFITWDDDRNFLQNPSYRGLGIEQLRWMWTTTLLGHYVPLSWMSLGLDYAVWGMNPFGYHLTNILLHSAAAATLYFVALRLLSLGFGKGVSEGECRLAAFLAALFYACNPLRVESVAWVTERRDVLSELLLLQCVLQYLRAQGNAAYRSRGMAVAVLFFVLALLSKASGVALPLLLLVLDVYPLRRIDLDAETIAPAAWRLVREKWPFFLSSLAAGIMAVVSLPSRPQLPLLGKVAVAAYGLCFYVMKTFVPTDLSPLYPMPATIHVMEPRFVISMALVVMVVGVAIKVRRSVPALLAAVIAFVVMTGPVLGAVQNGPQLVADRYTYLAGPVVACLFAAIVLRATTPNVRLLSLAIAVIAIPLGFMTWRQTQIWHDSETFWTYVAARSPSSALAHAGVGDALAARGMTDSAIVEYRAAIARDSLLPTAENNLGVALYRLGRKAEALTYFRRAAAADATYADAFLNLGTALAAQDSLPQAELSFSHALQVSPTYAAVQFNWGNALLRRGFLTEAIAHYQAAVSMAPDQRQFSNALNVAQARSRGLKTPEQKRQHDQATVTPE